MFRFTIRELVLLAIIVQSHAVFFAAISPAEGDTSPADPDPKNDEIRRVLDQPTEIDFIKTPIRSGAKFLSAQHKIPINVDRGVPGRAAATIKVSGVKLGDALKTMLDPHGLEYTVTGGAVVIRVKKP